MRRASGFTLIEIMIVVAVVALLSAIALPSFLRARERTRRTRYVNALRVVRDAVELYAAEHNGYPADAQPGVLPVGMQTYFTGKFNWTAPSPIGGRWDWDLGVLGLTAGVSVSGVDETPEAMAEIDAMIDDGDLTSGAFREINGDRYTWIIEK